MRGERSGRARALGLVLCALLIVPLYADAGPAATADPDRTKGWASRKAGAPRKTVLAYWSSDRMKRARPPRGPANADEDGRVTLSTGKFKGAVATGWDVPFSSGEIASTEGYPYSAVGKVFFSDPYLGRDYVCSGSVVSNEDEDLVWTAGHCIHPGTGTTDPFFTNWMFVPGYHDGKRPFGAWVADELYVLDGWRRNGNLRLDVGAARVVAPVTSTATVGETVGSLGIRFNTARRTDYWALGYPAAGPFAGYRRLWNCYGSLAKSDFDLTGAGPAPIGIGCDMTGGASGGPWIAGGGYLQSVTSYGYNHTPGVLYGPYHGSRARELYLALGGTDGEPSGVVEAPPPDRVPPKIRRVTASPDPFTPLRKTKQRTRIRFRLTERARVTVTIHRRKGGRVVRLGRAVIPAGTWNIDWNGFDSSGRVAPKNTYIFRIKALDGAGNARRVRGRVRLRR